MKKVKKCFELRIWSRGGREKLPSSEWSVCSSALQEEHRSGFTVSAKEWGVHECDTPLCLALFSSFICFVSVFLEIVKDMELSSPFWHEKVAVLGDYFPVCRCLNILCEALHREVLLQVQKQAELHHWDAVVSFLSAACWKQMSVTAGLELRVGSWRRREVVICAANLQYRGA